LVRVRSDGAGFCNYMHCITATEANGGNSVYKLANGAPAARISVNGGWLCVVGMPTGSTGLQLFAKAYDLLPHLKGPGSAQWNKILLPSVHFSGARDVKWLEHARYTDEVWLAGAMQHFSLDIALPSKPEIIPAPVVGVGESGPVVFNGPTLLVMVDMHYRIKWLCHYGAKDWEQFPM
jgi:hypothetical protein